MLLWNSTSEMKKFCEFPQIVSRLIICSFRRFIVGRSEISHIERYI